MNRPSIHPLDQGQVSDLLAGLGHDHQVTDLEFPQSWTCEGTSQDSLPFLSLSLECVVPGGLKDPAEFLKASLRPQG